MKGSDKVLIAVDANKSYIYKNATELPCVQQKSYKK